MTAADDAREPVLTAFLPFRAAPKGSMAPFIDSRGVPRVREDNARSAPTKDKAVAELTKAIWRHPRRREFPLDCPVEVTVTYFYVPPGNAGPLDRPSTNRTPDIDKATRLILDSLTQSGVIKDDARVVGLLANAWYDPRDGIQVQVGPARGNDGKPLTVLWSAVRNVARRLAPAR